MNIGLDKITRKRIQPAKGKFAICQYCERDLIPKCGEIRVHHWAHKNEKKCDHWWENETEWHRNWKSKFPIDWQEVVMFDSETGEKHIADIYNPNKDLVIEFQNSSIDASEIKSREQFYKRMIWVINAKSIDIKRCSLQSKEKDFLKFEKSCYEGRMDSRVKITPEIENKLLNKRNEILKKERITKLLIKTLIDSYNNEFNQLVFKYQIGAITPKGIEPNKFKNELLEPVFSNVRDEINKLISIKHKNTPESKNYGYKWLRKRKVWDYSEKHVFLDKDDYVFWLKSDWILKKIPKEKFINHYKL